MIFTDQLGREIKLNNTTKRIVSLVPSQTELLVDLGLEDAIVGITKFCVHPKEVRKNKTVVGGTKQIDFKKVKALNPDLILCNKEENTLEMIQMLESIAPVHISDIYNIKDCLELIKMYGDLFKVQTRSSEINNEISSKLERFKQDIKGMQQLRVAYFIWRKPWMVAASNTFINYLLELNNYTNVFAQKERYPEINIETLENENLDVIFLSSEPFPFNEKHVEELKVHAKNTQITLVDGEYFSWYGSRLRLAFDYFSKLRLQN